MAVSPLVGRLAPLAPSLRVISLDFSETLAFISGSVGAHYAQTIGTTSPAHAWLLDPSVVDELDTGFRSAYKATDAAFPNFGAAAGLGHNEWWWRVVDGTLSHTVASSGAAAALSGSGAEPESALAALRSTLVDDGVFDSLVAYFSSDSVYALYPDTVSALETLRSLTTADGDPMVLALTTNMTRKVTDTLESLDLARFFDVVVDSHSVGAAKPDPAIFAHTLAVAGVPDRFAHTPCALHVGDSVAADYVGAHNAPAFVPVLLNRAPAGADNIPAGVEPDLVVPSLTDLASALGHVLPPQ